MNNDVFTQLITLIKDYVQNGSELLGKTESLLTRVVSKLESYERTDIKESNLLNDVVVTIKTAENQLENLKDLITKSIDGFSYKLNDFIETADARHKSLFEKAIKELIEETKRTADKCTSDSCPKKEEIEDLQKDKKWYRRTSTWLLFICIVLMIGVILAFTLGISGIKIWLGLIPLPKGPIPPIIP